MDRDLNVHVSFHVGIEMHSCRKMQILEYAGIVITPFGMCMTWNVQALLWVAFWNVYILCACFAMWVFGMWRLILYRKNLTCSEIQPELYSTIPCP